MLKIVTGFLFLIFSVSVHAQPADYVAKLKAFQENYVKEHEVVLKKDKKYMRFFPVDENYRVKASFKKLTDTVGFIIKTSGSKAKRYFRYGIAQFTLQDSLLQLTIYQNESLMTDTVYKDYLFLPFTDLSSGEESYGGGRYIDLEIKDIKDNVVRIDFNRAYNPYCAYASGYNCPIPPGENYLPVAIRAGEKDYAKPWH